MNQVLAGKGVALLVANGFEEIEMTEPQRALLGAGASIKLVSPEQALVNGWHGAAWGHYFPVDESLSTALAADFDALLVPGGVRSIEKLAQSPHTQRFLRAFIDGGKPVVLFGDAATLLVDVERAAGQTVAAEGEAAAKLAQAGATVSEEEQIVSDGILLTIRGENDSAALKQAIVDHVASVAESLDQAA